MLSSTAISPLSLVFSKGMNVAHFSSHKCKSVYKSLYIVHVYHVALNFCGSLILQMGDFLCFAGTNFAIGKN